MKINTFPSLLSLAVFGMAAGSVNGATLMTIGFNNAALDINETTGWNGTTPSAGGSLATGLAVSSAMRIFGDFSAQNAPNNVFHVDNWQPTNSAATRVGMTIGVLSGYTFSLGSGSETISTRLHQHPSGPSDTDVFDKVELWINGSPVNGTAVLSQQSYTPGGGAQTLVWNIAANPALNNLTSATFDLYFRGTATPANNNHGPEWSLADGAFVSFTGTVVPETSQALLSSLGLALTLVRRKR